MNSAIFSLRSAASFRNQSALLYRAAVGLGLECEEKDLSERVNYPHPGWDRVVVLAPLWPRYVFDSVRLSTPWFARKFTLYGPVDGPLSLNVGLFQVMEGLKIVVPSAYCKACLEVAGIHVQKVVPHGIDPQDFMFSDLERYSRLEQLKKEHPGRTIFFSNLNPIHRKGFPHLAKAITLLYEKRPNDFIFILHTGVAKALQIHPELAGIPNLVLEDQYNVLPFRHMALKTKSCDVFVFPSLLEGFGLPVLEAAAAERPIVCCDMAPLNEIVTNKEAWLFPFQSIREEKWEGPGCSAPLHEYDPEILAKVMEQAMDNPKESAEKGAAALERSQAFNYMKVYGPFLKEG